MVSKKLFVIIALALITTYKQALALPLLAENAGITVNEVLTLYPDSDNPNVMYFMPNSSGITKSSETGLPLFGLTYWGLSNGSSLDDAGAWLTFTMHLKSNEIQKKALQSLLDEGKRIAVLPVQESAVSINTTNEGQVPSKKLFDEIHFGKKAGVMESEIGVNAVLTGVGAKVFKSGIENPQLLKMDYCFKSTGLGPNMKGTIHVKWDRVYDYFSASYSAGGFFSKKSISVEIEKLKQKNLVYINLDGGDATEFEKLQELAKIIINRLFVPELSASPGNGGGGGGWSFSRYSLKIVHKEELKEETWTINKRDLIDREFCLNLGLSDLNKYKDKIIIDADKE
ncbi:MAG: hypothetical protein M9962_07550 [Oligoflexia bacterium]|nr:hypothetical protein [Oligoflexia bacterium]